MIQRLMLSPGHLEVAMALHPLQEAAQQSQMDPVEALKHAELRGLVRNFELKQYMARLENLLERATS